MTSRVDLSVLPFAGANEALCQELQTAGCLVEAGRTEAVVSRADGGRLFRVVNSQVDQEVLRAVYVSNEVLKSAVGECRQAARFAHGDSTVRRSLEAPLSLIGFRGTEGRVALRVVKHHDHKKHAGYTPYASVNGDLYRLCRIAMEQFGGTRVADADRGLTEVQLAPQIRWDADLNQHVASAPLPAAKRPWGGDIVYAQSAPAAKKHHGHHKHH